MRRVEGVLVVRVTRRGSVIMKFQYDGKMESQVDVPKWIAKIVHFLLNSLDFMSHLCVVFRSQNPFRGFYKIVQNVK